MLKNRKIVFIMLIVTQAMTFSNCSKDGYLFDDEFWVDNCEMSRQRMTKSNPEPGNGQSNDYPSVDVIKSSTVVQTKMGEAWSNMKNSCSQTGRREYGFWIYYNKDNSSFWCGDMLSGEETGYQVGTGASISFPPPTNNQQACAFFHCHTSLHFAPEGLSRVTGPSTSDTNVANSWGCPGLLYDYSASEIYSGHSLDDSYSLYTFGPSSRTTP